jgi:hypothetical protein
MKIRQWTVKRSGDAMTVSGIDVDTGEAVKLTDVEKIQGGNAGVPSIVATTKAGELVELTVTQPAGAGV